VSPPKLIFNSGDPLIGGSPTSSYASLRASFRARAHQVAASAVLSVDLKDMCASCRSLSGRMSVGV
jgi:hypothetical protein